MNFKESLYILGAGGHGKVVCDVARSLNVFSEIYFLDDNYEMYPAHAGVRVLGGFDTWQQYAGDGSLFFVALGDCSIRRTFFDALSRGGARLCNLVSPLATISESVSMGSGVLVMPGAIVNADVRLKSNIIVNSGAIIEHDCIIGSHSHLAPGSILTGGVVIGQGVLIGAGALACPNIRITDHVTLAAGAVAISDLCEPGVYVGGGAVMLRKT